MINYVCCGACGAAGPYMCAGVFPPHGPMPIQVSPMGAYCGFCGPLPLSFTCSRCWTTQPLYVQGMARPPMGGMGSPYVAPVLQARQGASDSELRSGFKKLLMEFGSSAMQQAGQNFGNQMTSWY